MILGLVEHDRGRLNPHALEMLTLARRLAADSGVPLNALLVGETAAPLAAGLAPYGVETVSVADHDLLQDYAPEAWAATLAQLAEDETPAAVLAAGTDRGAEVMAHVAARLGQPLAANCTAVSPGPDYTVTRIRWGGSLLEEARLSGAPKLLTVAPLAVAAETAAQPGAAAIAPFTPELHAGDVRVRLVDRVPPDSDKISLGEARVVVGGGRGVGSAAGFAALDELAALLHGAVGGSRVVTNLGWRPHADQIGQTGTRIAPDLYIACGISGAIQHWVGCKNARHILAINTDPDAPMVAKADYAIIADLHEVLPALVEAINANYP